MGSLCEASTCQTHHCLILQESSLRQSSGKNQQTAGYPIYYLVRKTVPAQLVSAAQHRPFQFSTGVEANRLSLSARPRKGMKRGQEPRIAQGVLGVLNSKSKGRTYNLEPGICCHEHIVQILNWKEGPREGGCYHFI